MIHDLGSSVQDVLRGERMRLAIVALNAYPAVSPLAGTAIGGLETFAWSLARGLAHDPAMSVQFVVRNTSRPPQKCVDGVEIVCDVEPLRGIRHDVSQDIEVTRSFPFLHVKRFRPKHLWQVPWLAVARLAGPREDLAKRLHALLSPSRPDAILTLGVGDGSAAGVRAARLMGVPSWIWWQSNADLNEHFLTDNSHVDPYGVTSQEARDSYQATGIICQTLWQQSRTSQLLHRESTVIANPVDIEKFCVGSPSPESRQSVLWIGRYDYHHKRPHLALEIARLCPQIPFHLVINRGDPIVEREIRLHAPPNVRFTDYIPRNEMPLAFRNARLFLSTGSQHYEGFPNVLLESAASGTPIVSLEDFDGFLARSQAGVCSAGDVVQLADAMRTLWEQSDKWQHHSQSGASYVRSHHSLENCVQSFRGTIARTTP